MTATYKACNYQCKSILSHLLCTQRVMLSIPGLVSSYRQTTLSAMSMREICGSDLDRRYEERKKGLQGSSEQQKLGSTRSHHSGNHLHFLYLHPTTADKMA